MIVIAERRDRLTRSREGPPQNPNPSVNARRVAQVVVGGPLLAAIARGVPFSVPSDLSCHRKARGTVSSRSDFLGMMALEAPPLHHTRRPDYECNPL